MDFEESNIPSHRIDWIFLCQNALQKSILSSHKLLGAMQLKFLETSVTKGVSHAVSEVCRSIITLSASTDALSWTQSPSPSRPALSLCDVILLASHVTLAVGHTIPRGDLEALGDAVTQAILAAEPNVLTADIAVNPLIASELRVLELSIGANILESLRCVSPITKKAVESSVSQRTQSLLQTLKSFSNHRIRLSSPTLSQPILRKPLIHHLAVGIADNEPIAPASTCADLECIDQSVIGLGFLNRLRLFSSSVTTVATNVLVVSPSRSAVYVGLGGHLYSILSPKSSRCALLEG